MFPLIKWPGGKSSELEIIKKFIPRYDRYVEPFFGGGALFFDLPPQPSIINDVSQNLMMFYSLLKEDNRKFKMYMYSIYNEWENLKNVSSNMSKKLIPIYKKLRINNNFTNIMKEVIESACDEVVNAICVDTSMVIDRKIFRFELRRTVIDKVLRTAKNELMSGKVLSDFDLHANIMTGFTSGYYMYLRDTLNRIEKNTLCVSLEYKIAIFYFVREFCYGAMFRYNKSGDFNIPYGGIAYNNKDFKKKVDMLFSTQTQAHLMCAQIYSTDFENILDMADENDFIFLDPPYDTDFSDYENRRFGEQDQRRLEKKLHNTKAKFLLIIKNSPLISELYKNNGYMVFAFDNKYSYCVKGRNDRNAIHLIVTNYYCKSF